MFKKVIVGSLALASIVGCTAPAAEGDEEAPTIVPHREKAPAPSNTFEEGTPTEAPAATVPELVECATSTTAAVAKPLSLVFMFDRSGSMTSKLSPKWSLATAAATSFFESPDSKGVSASLSFFPRAGAITDGVSLEPITCETEDYVAPDVALKALPSPSFRTSIAAHAPNRGDTPTQPALQGALTYASDVARTTGGSVAIVLVTDGLPDAPDCGINPLASAAEIAEVKAIAAAAAATTPTYVIGVGDSLQNLDEIAIGGGTKSAFIVSTANTATIQADLLQAISSIKKTALECDYAIPAPPPGQSFDRDKINVQYTPETGAASALSYSPTCAGGAGWRYDSATKPTRIVACSKTCDEIKAKPGKVDIVLGCATRKDGVN